MPATLTAPGTFALFQQEPLILFANELPKRQQHREQPHNGAVPALQSRRALFLVELDANRFGLPCVVYMDVKEIQSCWTHRTVPRN
jgi:hypothetical protein